MAEGFIAGVADFLAGVFYEAADVWIYIGTIGQGLVEVAALTAAEAIVRNNTRNRAQGAEIQLDINPSAPRRLQSGKRMNAGVLVDWYLESGDGSRLHTIIVLGQGKMGPITEIWSGGRKLEMGDLDEHDVSYTASSLEHLHRIDVKQYRSWESGHDDGTTNPRVWVTYHDGRTGQEADGQLVGLGQGWTNSYTMTGMAYVHCRYHWDSDNVKTPPDLEFVLTGADYYDRRKDTTAGGSGSHRLKDPTTWEPSANPMVILDHYMLGRYVPKLDAFGLPTGNFVRIFGIGLDPKFIPYGRFAAQANICDENVALKGGGTQKRYECHGFIYSDDEYGDAIRRICKCMVAKPTDYDGLFGVVGPDAKTPVMTIDDSEMVTGVQEMYKPKRSWMEHVGGVQGRYQEPQLSYRSIPYVSVVNPDWNAADGGEPRMVTYDLESEIDGERAERLATIYANLERRAATLVGQYPPKTIELEKGDWFIRTGPKWGEGGKAFEVMDCSYNPQAMLNTITSREVNPDDVVWDETTAGPGVTVPDQTSDGTFFAITPPSITVTEVSIAGASFSKPGLKIVATATDDRRALRMAVEIKRTLVSGEIVTATALVIPGLETSIVVQDGIVDGPGYSVRARYMGAVMRSAWCTPQTITPTGAFTIGGRSALSVVSDIESNANSIALAALKQTAWRAANDASLWIGGDRIGTYAMNTQETVDDNVLSIDLIGSRNVGDSAFVLNASTVVIGASGAFTAKNLSTLRTEHEGNTADVSFLMTSVGGASAQATLSLDVNGYVLGWKAYNGGSPINSGFYIYTDNFAIIGGSLTSPFYPFSVVGTTVKMLNVIIDTLEVNIVDTIHIKNASVSDSGSVQMVSSVSGSGSGFNTILSITVVLPYAAEVDLLFSATQGYASSSKDYGVKIKNGSTVLKELAYSTRAYLDVLCMFSAGNALAAGTYTFTVEWAGQDSGIAIDQGDLAVTWRYK